MTQWVDRTAQGWDGSGELAPFPNSTPFAEHLLSVAREQYAPFVLANSNALAQGDKAFKIETYGEMASYLARPYPEQSRDMVKERIRSRLNDNERKIVDEWLSSQGLAEAFQP